MELSLDEVLALARETGFTIAGDSGEVEEKRRQRAVECEYTADKTAMMRWLYQAEFWVATRVD